MKLLLYSEKTKLQYMLIPICNNHVLINNGFISQYHIHPVYHLVFVLRGDGTLETGSKTYFLQEKDVFMVDPNEKHVYTSTRQGGMTHFTTNFYLVTLEDYQRLQQEGVWEDAVANLERIEALAVSAKLDEILDFKHNEIFFDYDKSRWSDLLLSIDTFCGAIDNIAKNPYYIISGGYKRQPLIVLTYYWQFITAFFEIIAGASTHSNEIHTNSNDALLNKIIAYLNNSLYNSFHLSDLSASLNYSPVYLCSYFKQKTGITITQYLNKLRIKKACDYLRESNKSITEIASLLNYSSSNHFSANFKKEMKYSPKHYRRRPELF
jgi:AraC-like DNA-binding protein